MSHPSEEDLVLHLYGEANESDFLREHLESCARCRDEVALLRQVLAEVDEVAPPERPLDYAILLHYYFRKQDVFPGAKRARPTLGLTGGISIQDPKDDQYLGLFWQPTDGIQLTGGVNFARRTQLQDGVSEGTVLDPATTVRESSGASASIAAVNTGDPGPAPTTRPCLGPGCRAKSAAIDAAAIGETRVAKSSSAAAIRRSESGWSGVVMGGPGLGGSGSRAGRGWEG